MIPTHYMLAQHVECGVAARAMRVYALRSRDVTPAGLLSVSPYAPIVEYCLTVPDQPCVEYLYMNAHNKNRGHRRGYFAHPRSVCAIVGTIVAR